MKKIIIVVAAGLMLAGCQTARQDRAVQGAVIGGVAGTAIGAAAGGSVGSAVAGGVVGAAAGGIIGANTGRSEPCYVRTRSGALRRVSCY